MKKLVFLSILVVMILSVAAPAFAGGYDTQIQPGVYYRIADLFESHKGFDPAWLSRYGNRFAVRNRNMIELTVHDEYGYHTVVVPASAVKFVRVNYGVPNAVFTTHGTKITRVKIYWPERRLFFAPAPKGAMG